MSTYLGRKGHDKDYGLGEHTFDADRLGLIDEPALTDRLMRTFTAPGYQPPRLPAVALELLSLSRQPDVEFAAIEALLEQDAMLTGEIFSIARSAHYSGLRQVTSLHQALVRIGLAKLRQIVLQASMNMRVFRSAAYGDCMERLRQHCRKTAHLCRIVSHYTPLPEEESFLCGLLHDIGIAGILLALGDVARGEKPPELTVLWPAIHGAHPGAGSRMVALWGLPSDLALVVGAHHQVSIEGHDHPMAALVCVAEALSVELEMHFVPPATSVEGAGEAALAERSLLSRARFDRSDSVVVSRARAALGLNEATLDLIRGDARKWIATER